MPLVRARCRACSLPLGDAPYTSLPVACGRCGLTSQVAVAADGQPVELAPSFGPMQLLEWLGYARGAMASGSLGVALGACPACRAPLVVSSKQLIALPCPHCGEAVQGSAAEVIVDQWTEPFTHVAGGNVDVEYRLVTLEDTHGVSAGCAACGGPAVANGPDRCAACGAVTWLPPRPRAGPEQTGRLQLAVRIDGTRAERPFKALVPIVTAEGMLRADATHGTSARSGSSLLGLTGVGCASAVAITVLVAVAIAVAAHFTHC